MYIYNMYIHLVFLLFVFLHVRCIPQTEFVTTVLSKCVCVTKLCVKECVVCERLCVTKLCVKDCV